MTDSQALVREFHEASGQEVRDVPSMPSDETRLLRGKLILEETLEVFAALGLRLVMNGSSRRLELIHAGHPDMEGVAHELADLKYVVDGTAVSFGVQLGPVTEEVHRAKMAKVHTNGIRTDASGKILKPPGWKPADVASVLRKQGWRDE